MPFWTHFDSILASFWAHVGSILRFWGVLGGGAENVTIFPSFWRHFGLPLGSIFYQKSIMFSIKNASLFVSIFNRFLGSLWLHVGVHFASKNIPETKKAILWKWASRLHESLIFGAWGPQNPSEMPPKINQKMYAFVHWKNDCKSERRRLPRGTKDSPKGVQKKLLKKH